ncbi:MAG: lipoyl synthase [Chloroflexi bacterium]|nr:lipoyl synthase [Chloroflexota bacterium]
MSELTAPRRLPRWLKAKAPGSPGYLELKRLVTDLDLNTVCQSAHCPNIGECWESGTATFMILGDVCTRACSYCNVKTGKPLGLDLGEPHRVAQTVVEMGLSYIVVTSVDRDDLPDGGSGVFAMTIKQLKERVPGISVEVLIPDFNGDRAALETVMRQQPDVLNHNIESVRRIFRKVRPRGDYDLSLELLARAKEIASGSTTKSGIMVGLGETKSELFETMRDLRDVECDLLTIGQYLRPTRRHHPVIRFYHPDEFREFEEEGLSMGFKHVAAGPLVRSSYHAEEQQRAASNRALATVEA